MDILADENVPEEFVSALRGDGHTVRWTRDIEDLGPEAPDATIVEYAESADATVLSSDQKDFNEMHADIPILIAPQDMTGGEVRRAVAVLGSLPADPAHMVPIWLTGLI